MWKNNPASIALQENQVIASNKGGQDPAEHDPAEDDPAYLWSLGTGSSQSIRDRWHDRDCGGIWSLPLRLWDFLDAHFHGKRSWREFVLDHPVLEAQGKLLRFDVEFNKPEPGMDDVDCMAEMQDAARQRFEHSVEIANLINAIVVDMFYFELRSSPRHERGEVVVEGRMLCRWKAVQEGFAEWLAYVAQARVRVFLDGQSHGSFELDRHGNLFRDINVRLNSLQQRVVIQIQVGARRPRHLGGSPFSVWHLARIQGLDTVFGTARRANLKRSASVGSHPSKRQRRT